MGWKNVLAKLAGYWEHSASVIRVVNNPDYNVRPDSFSLAADIESIYAKFEVARDIVVEMTGAADCIATNPAALRRRRFAYSLYASWTDRQRRMIFARRRTLYDRVCILLRLTDILQSQVTRVREDDPLREQLGSLLVVLDRFAMFARYQDSNTPLEALIDNLRLDVVDLLCEAGSWNHRLFE